MDRADWPLDALCGFAARRSRKRGFVFVSKVLGRHWPCRPAVVRRSLADLARRLPADAPGPVVFVGLAETAVGLGQGVFEEWLARTGRRDGLFLHTTRYRLDRPLALEFLEEHSHAPAHLLYEPARRDLFDRASTLVLIDDELSTGRTLVNLARAFRRRVPSLSAVWVACLTDWLGDRRPALAAEVGLPADVVSLLAGRFAFDPDPGFDPGVVPDVTGRGDPKDGLLRANFGRFGVTAPLPAPLPPPAAGRVLVLGTGEFVYPPFRLAEELERGGADVWFQSATRSPLLAGDDIGSVLEFADNYGDGMPNFLYNAGGRAYDRVLIGYETPALPPDHRLPELLGGEPVFF